MPYFLRNNGSQIQLHLVLLEAFLMIMNHDIINNLLKQAVLKVKTPLKEQSHVIGLICTKMCLILI